MLFRSIQTSSGNAAFYSDLVVQNLRSQNQNWGASGLRGFAAPWFADGGYTGPGGKYEPAGIVHKGEIVWSQSDIRRFGGVGAVEALRTNDNLAMPAMPVPVMGGGGDMRAVVAELKALRAELAAHKAATVRATVAAAEHVGEEVKVVAAVQSDAARDMRNRAA